MEEEPLTKSEVTLPRIFAGRDASRRADSDPSEFSLPENPSSRMLVTGAKGFLGSAVMRSARAQRLQHLGIVRPGDVEDSDTRSSIVQKPIGELKSSGLLRPNDTVFIGHGASNPVTASLSPELAVIDENVALLAFLKDCLDAGVKRVIIPSSGGAIYGNVVNGSAREELPPHPQTQYGLGKLLTERLSQWLAQESGLETVCLRISNAYGPGQNPTKKQGIVAAYIEALLTRQPFILSGELDSERDYIHVDDVATVVTHFAASSSAPGLVNVGFGASTRLDDLLRKLEQRFGPAQEVIMKTATGQVHRSSLSVNRLLQAMPSFRPLDLESGLARTPFVKYGE